MIGTTGVFLHTVCRPYFDGMSSAPVICLGVEVPAGVRPLRRALAEHRTKKRRYVDRGDLQTSHAPGSGLHFVFSRLYSYVHTTSACTSTLLATLKHSAAPFIHTPWTSNEWYAEAGSAKPVCPYQ